VLIDGERCSFTDATFHCGSSSRPYVGRPDESLIYDNRLYRSTDGCSAGPD
jgi:hypothetical protein